MTFFYLNRCGVSMKKIIGVSLITAITTIGSAQAVTVYKQDGTQLDINGSVRIVATQSSHERTSLVDDGSRFKFNFSQKINDKLDAIGSIRVELEDDNSNPFDIYEAYAGLADKEWGTITVGRQYTTGNDLGVSNYTYDLGGINQTVTEGDQVIKYKSPVINGFNIEADYVFNQNSTADKTIKNDQGMAVNNPRTYGWGAGLFYTGNLTQNLVLTSTLGLSRQNEATFNNTAYTLGAELAYKKLSVAVDYATNKSNNGQAISNELGDITVPGNYQDLKLIELGAMYQVTPKAAIYGEYI